MDLSQLADWTVAIITLTSLEVVLGIDNVVLLSILVEKLPESERARARKIGLALAMIFRLVLLSALAWLSHMTAPLVTIMAKDLSLRDLILMVGGLFLLYKATTEIFHFVEQRHDKPHSDGQAGTVKRVSFGVVLSQIVLFDLIFSLDSVLTAIGLAKEIFVMAIAVVLAAVLMIVFANAIGRFVTNNPALKLLALAFLVMIGVLLVAEGFGSHFDRGYVYFSMAFSLLVELLNERRRKKEQSSPP